MNNCRGGYSIIAKGKAPDNPEELKKLGPWAKKAKFVEKDGEVKVVEESTKPKLMEVDMTIYYIDGKLGKHISLYSKEDLIKDSFREERVKGFGELVNALFELKDDIELSCNELVVIYCNRLNSIQHLFLDEESILGGKDERN